MMNSLKRKMNNYDYLNIYLMKLDSLQKHGLMIEELYLSIYVKYNECTVQKDFKELLNDKLMRKIYIDNEWNYSLPINTKFKFITENEEEYYKELYVYREELYIKKFNYSDYTYPYNYDESIANDFLRFKLNYIYQCNNLNLLDKPKYVKNNNFGMNWYSRKWFYSYDFDISKYTKFEEPHVDLCNMVSNPECMLKYIRNIDNDYNDRTKHKLWNWKIMDDKKEGFHLIMKIRKQQKKTRLSTYLWREVYSYIF